jgi:precorrin-8X/cobalt-precorrin-8 methylmutase
MIKYETNPKKLRKQAYEKIRQAITAETLAKYSKSEQQIILRIIYSCGDLSMLDKIRISKGLVDKALEVLDEDYELLCDTEVVIAALKQKLLKHEPLCLINKASVISQAKANKQTRSMIAVDLWSNYLPGSIILIGNEPTALFRLMEKLEENQEKNGDDEEVYNEKKPALIIATPVGFSGAEEAKDYLWEHHEQLGIPCITILGTRGGGMLAASALNALFKIKQGVFY